MLAERRHARDTQPFLQVGGLEAAEVDAELEARSNGQQVFRLEELPPEAPAAETELPEHAENLDLAPPLLQAAFAPVEGRIGEWRALDDADEVLFREVRLGGAPSHEGAVGIGFSSDGASDPAEIWLRDDGGYELRIRVVAFTGEIRVEEVDAVAP